MYAKQSPKVTPAQALDALERRVNNPRPVSHAALVRREKLVYRMVRKIEQALDMIDADAHHDAWMATSRLLGRAYAIHSVACRRCEEAFEAFLAERYEAEELGAALQLERVSDLLYGVGLVA
jgi:hypothetical protein